MARAESSDQGALLSDAEDVDDDRELYANAQQNDKNIVNGDVVLFKRDRSRNRPKKSSSFDTHVLPKRLQSNFSHVARKFTKSGRLYRSFLLFSAFLGLGLCIALPGPTLLDLEERTRSSTDQMSYLFAGRSVGYLSGSLIGGVLFDRLNQMLLLGFSLLLTGAATLIFPWSSTLVLAIVLIGFQGFSMGMLDTGGNAFCIRLWGRQSPPYLQGLHFAFGVGAFLAPLIAEPFLSSAPIIINAPLIELNSTIAPHIHSRQKRELNNNWPSDSGSYDGVGENAQYFPEVDDPSAVKKSGDMLATPSLLFGATSTLMAENEQITTPTTEIPIYRTLWYESLPLLTSFATTETKTTTTAEPQIEVIKPAEKTLTSTVSAESILTSYSVSSGGTSSSSTTSSSTSPVAMTTTASSASASLSTVVAGNMTTTTVISTTTVPWTTTGTFSNGSETSTTIRHKPAMNDGSLLPDQSQSSADSSKNEAQIKKDVIAKGGSDVVLKPPEQPAPQLPVVVVVEAQPAAVFTTTSTPTSSTFGPNSTTPLNNATESANLQPNSSAPVVGVEKSSLPTAASVNDTVTEPLLPPPPPIITPRTEVLTSRSTVGLSVISSTQTTSTTTKTTTETPPSTLSSVAMKTKKTTTTQSTLIVPPLVNNSPAPGVQLENSTVATQPQNSTTTSTTPRPPSSTSTTAATTAQPVELVRLAPIQTAYMIVSIIIGIIAAGFLLLGLSERLPSPCRDHLALVESQSESGLYHRANSTDQPFTDSSPKSPTDETPPATPRELSACPSGFHIQLLVLLFIFYLLYVGGEVSFGQFISAYAERAQHWSRKDAAYVASAFWGALAAGRGAAIPLTRYLRPASIIAIDLTLLTVGMLGLLIGAQSFDTALWICTAVAGFGMSSIFASGFSWTERYIPITGKISSVLVAGAAVGEMVLPVLAGFLFVRNPQSLAYLMSAISLLLAVLFVLLQNLALNGQDGIYLHSRSSKRFAYDNEGQGDERELVESPRQREAVRLLPIGNGSVPAGSRLQSPSSANSEPALRRSGAGSSASGNSSSSRSHTEHEDVRTKAALYDIFDDLTGKNGDNANSRKQTTMLASNGSAVLIGDDDEDEDNENFYDTFPVVQRVGSNNNNNSSREDGEILLMDRRNIQASNLTSLQWKRGDTSFGGNRMGSNNNRLMPSQRDRSLLL